MSKMSKAIAVLGVVAGLGVAALPLSTYAAGSSASKNGQVQVQVEGAIAINIVDPETDNAEGITLTNGLLDLGTLKVNGAPATGAMGVQVATNNATGYTLQIKAATTADMVGSGDAAGSVIPANAAVAAGTAGWAYKGGGVTANTAISTTAAQLKKTTTAPTGTAVDGKASEVTDVTFTVAADSTTTEGTYTGTVVFMATAND